MAVANDMVAVGLGMAGRLADVLMASSDVSKWWCFRQWWAVMRCFGQIQVGEATCRGTPWSWSWSWSTFPVPKKRESAKIQSGDTHS